MVRPSLGNRVQNWYQKCSVYLYITQIQSKTVFKQQRTAMWFNNNDRSRSMLDKLPIHDNPPETTQNQMSAMFPCLPACQSAYTYYRWVCACNVPRLPIIILPTNLPPSILHMEYRMLSNRTHIQQISTIKLPPMYVQKRSIYLGQTLIT